MNRQLAQREIPRVSRKEVKQRANGHTSPVTKYLSAGADRAYGRPSWNGGDTRSESCVGGWRGSGDNRCRALDSCDLFANGPGRCRTRHHRPCRWTTSGVHQRGGGEAKHFGNPCQPDRHLHRCSRPWYALPARFRSGGYICSGAANNRVTFRVSGPDWHKFGDLTATGRYRAPFYAGLGAWDNNLLTGVTDPGACHGRLVSVHDYHLLLQS